MKGRYLHKDAARVAGKSTSAEGSERSGAPSEPARKNAHPHLSCTISFSTAILGLGLDLQELFKDFHRFLIEKPIKHVVLLDLPHHVRRYLAHFRMHSLLQKETISPAIREHQRGATVPEAYGGRAFHPNAVLIRSTVCMHESFTASPASSAKFRTCCQRS